LIVEDNPKSLKLVGISSRPRVYQTIEAETGEEACASHTSDSRR